MRIAVLISGGVDSSVALRLLHQAGDCELHAFYLKIWLEDEMSFLGECPWEEDLRYARAVCEQAGVPLEVVSMQRQYHDSVVAWAIGELREGRTPSPDLWCNQWIKFGAFLEQIDAPGRGFDRVASGHYARIERHGECPRLLKAADPVKDQTYFLSRLSHHQLERCEFPVGAYMKAEVRRLAADFSLPNRARKDSQGICFLGKISFDQFVHGYLGEQPGEIREVSTGRCLGEHRGYWFHTIGQRKGLGLGGGPWYVVRKDVATNVLYVAHGHDLEGRRRVRFRLEDCRWLEEPAAGSRLEVKIRHTPHAPGCHMELQDDGWVVTLDEADAGLAPGQSAVFYKGDLCLGGGMIGEVAG